MDSDIALQPDETLAESPTEVSWPASPDTEVQVSMLPSSEGENSDVPDTAANDHSPPSRSPSPTDEPVCVEPPYLEIPTAPASPQNTSTPLTVAAGPYEPLTRMESTLFEVRDKEGNYTLMWSFDGGKTSVAITD
jgi:hypothetical protein